MAKTIQTALRPLLIVGALCGLCVFEFPLGRSRLYFTCVYFLIAWSTYSFSFSYLLITTEEVLVPPLCNMIIIISSFVSMLASLFRFKELNICLRQLSVVDDTLKVLGTPKEYRQLYKWMIAVIISWIVLGSFLNGLDIFWESWKSWKSDTIIMDICIVLLENLLLHIGTFNGLILGTILGYTGSRFERVNNHIRNMLENNAEHSGERNASIMIAGGNVLEAEECKRRAWIIMHVHLQLTILSRKLNKVFSVQLTLEMASLFTILVETFFDFYSLYVDDDTHTLYQIVANLSLYIYVVVFTLKLFLLNHICQSVCDKANEAIAILYKLSNKDIGEDLREQIFQFILQIKQREVKFSGMGLFYFGNNFIRKFFTSMLTVLIIIIQMHGLEG